MPYKTCSCCAQSFTEAEWSALPYVGVVESEDDAGTYVTQMRNCPCGSTIAVESMVEQADANLFAALADDDAVSP